MSIVWGGLYLFMTRDKLIRDKISEKVYEEVGKKVRNVFYLTSSGDKVYYCIVGNNNNIFGVASVDMKDNIEVIV